jgi:hypothetical protein
MHPAIASFKFIPPPQTIVIEFANSLAVENKVWKPAAAKLVVQYPALPHKSPQPVHELQSAKRQTSPKKAPKKIRA